MTVLVVAEFTPAGVHPVTLELLTAARAIADDVAVVALGPGAAAIAETVGAYGATALYVCEDEALVGAPRSAAHVLARLVSDHAPDLVLFSTAYDARDVAGRLQARTGSTLMGNATGVSSPERASTEILGGSQIVEVMLQGPSPRLVLMKPRSIDAEPSGGSPAGVVTLDADLPPDLRDARVIERHEEASSGPSLDDARVVVAGGRGLGGPDAFSILDDLSAAIGSAAVGASRAAVDAGWVPYSYQIGQTGRTVKPEVYLAVGISGALQHVVGMRGSARIVAINKDADAPIMRMADLGVVGDLAQVVPALTEEVRRRTGS